MKGILTCFKGVLNNDIKLQIKIKYTYYNLKKAVQIIITDILLWKFGFDHIKYLSERSYKFKNIDIIIKL